MLSGIKIIPRDQLVSTNSESDEDLKNTKTKEKRDRRKRKEKRRRRREYSSESNEDSDSSGSGSNSEEDRKSKRKRRSRRKERSKDSSSSDEHENRKGGNKGRKKLSDDGGEETPIQNENELARKEMGLEWMLNSGSRSDRRAIKTDAEPEEPQADEVQKENPRELNPYLKENGSG